jgi:NTP pyrophosphatase (non-canonical NTP hydrolase)
MTIVSFVSAFSRIILDERTISKTFDYLLLEVDELRDEVAVHPDKFGPDGIFGEAVDVMINCIDLIQQVRPDLSPTEIEAVVAEYAKIKCRKWNDKHMGIWKVD